MPSAISPASSSPPCPCDVQSSLPPCRTQYHRRNPALSRSAPAGICPNGSGGPSAEALLQNSHGFPVVPVDRDGGVVREHGRQRGNDLHLVPAGFDLCFGIDDDEGQLPHLLPACELKDRPDVAHRVNGLLDGPQAEVVGHSPVIR